MSCILYTRGNYNGFEDRSSLLNHLYLELVRGTHYPLPIGAAEFLFTLNADAYRMAYGHHGEATQAEIDEAAANLSFDKPDFDFAEVKDWNNFAQVWHLLRRIRYQCSEFPQGHPGNDRMDLLERMIDHLVRMQMDKLTSIQGIPAVALQYC